MPKQTPSPDQGTVDPSAPRVDVPIENPGANQDATSGTAPEPGVVTVADTTPTPPPPPPDPVQPPAADDAPEADMTELVMGYSEATGKASPMSRLMAQMSGCEVLDDVSTHGPDGSPRDVTDRHGNAASGTDDEPWLVKISDADQAPAEAVTASADQQKEQNQ